MAQKQLQQPPGKQISTDIRRNAVLQLETFRDYLEWKLWSSVPFDKHTHDKDRIVPTAIIYYLYARILQGYTNTGDKNGLIARVNEVGCNETVLKTTEWLAEKGISIIDDMEGWKRTTRIRDRQTLSDMDLATKTKMGIMEPYADEDGAFRALKAITLYERLISVLTPVCTEFGIPVVSSREIRRTALEMYGEYLKSWGQGPRETEVIRHPDGKVELKIGGTPITNP